MLRIAVVDAGDLWQKYGEALRRVEGVEIGVVVDRDEDAARQLLVSVGGESFSRSIDELDARRQTAFDAAVVHSPLISRADTACAAAGLGKHLLVDAPLATTLDDVDRVSQACQSAGVGLMMRQPMRNSPAISSLRSALGTGNLGVPGLVRLHHWATHFDDADDSSEMSQWIWDLCYREVDVACWLFDAQPERVFALRIDEDAASVARGIQLHLGFSGGGMALVDCLTTTRSSETPYFMLTLIGSTGAAYVDDHRNTNLLIQNQTTSLLIDSSTDATLQLHDFAQFISSGHKSNSVDDARRVTGVIHAALESIESGSSVPIG